MSEYKTTSHCKYLCQYHLIWCPKFRFNVLENVECNLKQIFQDIAEKYQYEIIEMEVMPDHVHIFISAKPEFSPVMIIKVLKGVTSLRLFKKYPELKEELWGGHLWSPSYYVGTAGSISAETIRKYIQNQKSNSSTL